MPALAIARQGFAHAGRDDGALAVPAVNHACPNISQKSRQQQPQYQPTMPEFCSEQVTLGAFWIVSVPLRMSGCACAQLCNDASKRTMLVRSTSETFGCAWSRTFGR